MNALALVGLSALRVAGTAADLALLAPRPALARCYVRGKAHDPYVVDAAVAGDLDDEDLVYGEVFVTSARALLQGLHVGAADIVVDLGCGRGNVLLAAAMLGARARGVDVVASHIDAIRRAASDAGIVVQHGDARTARVDDATVVWLSWATWSKPLRAAVSAHLARALPIGARVIGLMWEPGEGFELAARDRLTCTWGRADVVVCRRAR